MGMKTITFEGLTLYYDAGDGETAELVQQACTKSLSLIQNLWGLASPQDCRIYVLNSSWLGCLFHAAPWGWRFWMGITLPLWYFRAKRSWQLAAGWALPFGKRRFVGIKPPRLIQLSDRSMGSRIFTQPDNLEAKVQHTACHELTHACAAPLRLPAWLNEGLAMFTVDEFVGGSTIRLDTLAILRHSTAKPAATRYQRVNLRDHEAIVYLYVRGYWITRFLEETQPGLLKQLLTQRFGHQELETRIASACGMSREAFWQQIDPMIASHYSI
jgi:hypothetical protein